ncbi:GntR family transcriptional regulator [Streptomyces sp. NPDC005393]|uniref:GntR family transcriptional regulator n=1 Tax=Streptomyces sp. NPDC005393 TaxID=3157041 RepID=UPI0033A82836
MSSPILIKLSEVWDAARDRLAESGTRLTLARISRETGVPVATLSDWRRGNHAPREPHELLRVVAVLCDWAGLPQPLAREWINLLEIARAPQPGEAEYQTAEPTPTWTPTSIGLSERLSSAFSRERVQIDAVCLTGQTLSLALAGPIQQVYAGTVRPQIVEMRLMLPSRSMKLAFPVPVIFSEDSLVRNHWLSQRNTQGQAIRSALTALRASHGIDVRVSFRAIPFTPMAEIYIINRSETLFSYCLISRHEEEISDTIVDIYDASRAGIGMLGRFSQDSEGDREATFVEQSMMWFDSVWVTVATELKLT